MDREQEAIIKTLAYFDIFEMPLTSIEIFEYLYWPHREDPERTSVESTLEKLLEEKKVFHKDGFYSLKEELKIAQRKSRQARTMQWLKKSRRWLTILASWPGVEAIAVCNTASWFQVKETSDLDLFIITKPDQIWQSRFALAAFLQIFKKRTNPNEEDSGKFCLSFFVQSEALELKPVVLPEEDIYFAYWLKFLLPIYDPKALIDKLYKKNHYLYAHVARQQPEYYAPLWQVDHESGFFKLSQLIASQATWFPNALERWTKKWQLKKLPEKIKQAAASGQSHVVVSDDMLKFHTNDRREQFRDQWKKNYQHLL